MRHTTLSHKRTPWPTMKFALAFLFMVFGVCSCVAAIAAEPPQLFRWEHKLDVPESVTVTVHSVSDYKLRALMAQYGSRDRAQAVSVLHRRGDEWSCEIFIGPTQDRSGAFVHELKHCHGWAHE